MRYWLQCQLHDMFGVTLRPSAATADEIYDVVDRRLREDAWGKGYAVEAARACLDWAWSNLEVDRIVAITVPANRASWSVMERLCMTRRPDLDFAHPSFATDHPLSEHITYVMERTGA